MEWEVEDETFLMQQAMNCANSDSCSLEEAEEFLEGVLHVQSACASGALIGSAICTNVDAAAETVANLRAKIARKSKELIAKNVSMSALNVSLVMIMLSVVVAGSTLVNPDVAPFTPQEWWWAIRDGYFPLMLEHYFRDGGLPTIDFTPETTSFALQEWYWAIRDGYFLTMAEHFFKNGGLSVGEVDGLASVPFTLQEWSWAFRGGYADQLVADAYRTGGLSGVESGSDVLPFTAEEWVWAVKHGYAQQMAESFFRNGGL